MCEVYNCSENYGECYSCFKEIRLESLTDKGICYDCLEKRKEPEMEEEPEEIIEDYDRK